MSQESPAQVGVFADPAQPGVGGNCGLTDGIGAEVGEFAGFQVAPDEAEAALVLETDPGFAPAGVPFFLGQSSKAQRAIASSSRSTARRAGRWRLQPIWCSTLQT